MCYMHYMYNIYCINNKYIIKKYKYIKVFYVAKYYKTIKITNSMTKKSICLVIH